MIAVKNQPDTALPWYAAEWTCHAPTTVLVDDPSHILGKKLIADCEEVGDAAYIALAANAYPKLIEALQKAAAELGRFPPRTAAEQQRADESLALLRDIGEASK